MRSFKDLKTLFKKRAPVEEKVRRDFQTAIESELGSCPGCGASMDGHAYQIRGTKILESASPSPVSWNGDEALHSQEWDLNKEMKEYVFLKCSKTSRIYCLVLLLSPLFSVPDIAQMVREFDEDETVKISQELDGGWSQF